MADSRRHASISPAPRTKITAQAVILQVALLYYKMKDEQKEPLLAQRRGRCPIRANLDNGGAFDLRGRNTEGIAADLPCIRIIRAVDVAEMPLER